MNCSKCNRSTLGEAVAMIYVGMDSPRPGPARFTGLVWCRTCVLGMNLYGVSPDLDQVLTELDLVTP